MRLKVPFQLLLTLLTTASFAVTVPITANIDATIKISNGSNTETVILNAQETKDISLSWASASTALTIDGTPENNRFYDTTFTTTLADNPKLWQAWNSSSIYMKGDTVSHNNKNWTAGWQTTAGTEPGTTGEWGVWQEVPSGDSYQLVIDFTSKPLPQDTAFVPFVVNVNATLKATPLSMISGETPSKTFTFDLTGKKNDTIHLPVITDGTPVAGTPIHNTNDQLSMINNGNKFFVSLPSIYKNGKLNIFSLKGQKIASMNLTSITQNDISVWNVASGLYLMQVSAPGGKSIAKKLHHKGGDLQISAAYGTNFKTGGLLNSSNITTTSRSNATASYKFEITADEERYNDTTLTVNFTGQMNELVNVYLIDPNGSNFGLLVSEDDWEKLFPNRYGLGYGAYINDPLPQNPTKLASDGDYDFYTYESLNKAMDSISLIEVDLYQLVGHNYMHRIVWRNKKTGQTRTMVNNAEYENYKQTSEEVLIQTVDYGNFCNEGDLETQKLELAAFFGNISHETTGGGTEEKSKTWGLYWREEAAWQNGSTSLGYVDQFPNALYPPTGGKSYHGRGPIQVTHNVNYGQLSEFLYGDKQILLDNPDALVPDKPEDATLAFMSAIWFWMTPQAPKPSCHDVMVGNWTASPEEAAKNWNRSKFGMTIFIINGGLECNKGDGTSSPLDRIEFYQRYCEVLGVTPEDYCDCGNMSQ